MTSDELINEILNSFSGYGFDIKHSNNLANQAYINVRTKKLIFNPLTVTPYALMHEFVHYTAHHEHRQFANDIRNMDEHEANKLATGQLWDMWIASGGTDEYISNFINATGVPDYQVGRLLHMIHI
ncbi:hypothetical protein ACOV5J_02885 [Weissella soli]|uniref:hypothetical protein n=1 Tax=Weissella soli TaxID=155866 RepID=UPI003C74D3D6